MIQLNILLLSHGNFASGLKSSAELITGKNDNLFAIDLYLDSEKLDDKLKQLKIKTEIDEENLIVLTDIQGGSVTQEVVTMFDLSKVNIITGMNLPLLLTLLTSGLDKVDKSKLDEMIEISKNSILNVTDFINASNDDDF